MKALNATFGESDLFYSDLGFIRCPPQHQHQHQLRLMMAGMHQEMLLKLQQQNP
ncbi:MAG: hypothetical protein R2861_15180 [Desulfobacterales bacterium]